MLRSYRKEITERGQHSPEYLNYYVCQVLRNLPPITTLADIGCGTGFHARLLRHTFPNVKYIGIDFSQATVEYIKTQGTFDEVHWASSKRLPLTESVDVALSMENLEHLYAEDLLDALKELKRVGRYVIITTPTPDRVVNVPWLTGETAAASQDQVPLTERDYIALESCVHKSVIFPDSLRAAGFQQLATYGTESECYYGESDKLDLERIRFVAIRQRDLLTHSNLNLRYIDLLTRSLSLNSEIQRANKKLGFHAPHFSERGAIVALYDYADYHEKLYGSESIILYKRDHPASHPETEQRFKKRFRCYGYSQPVELEALIREHQLPALYHITYGTPQWLPAGCKNLVHAVFTISPYGDRYAAISESLASGKVPAVPHMISLPDDNGTLHEELNLPNDAIIVGRHGGVDTFNIAYVPSAMSQALEQEPRLHFLLMNTAMVLQHPRVHYLAATWDPIRKRRFINTCHAMLHARQDGETFGLAVGEFSSCNKPVLTTTGNDNNHLEILGDKAVRYHDIASLVGHLTQIPGVVAQREDWHAYRAYTPEKVMEIFEEVFLKDL